MSARVLRSVGFPMVVLVVPLVASLSSAACSGRVNDCAELGSDWTSCDGLDAGPAVPNVCVLKAEKGKACAVAAGSSTTNPTPPTPTTTSDAAACSLGTPDLCSGKCVDLRFDRKNCGRCGTACASSDGCFDGVCQ